MRRKSRYYPEVRERAVRMVQNGVTLYEVQHVVGHTTPVMTQRYAHLQPDHLRHAMNTLDATLRGPATSSATHRSQGAESPSATPPK